MIRPRSLRCRYAVLGDVFVTDARIDLDEHGVITAAGTEHDLREQPSPELVIDLGRSLVVPGFVNAHSHAFQRAIRGRTHVRGQHDPSSFWSWREAMYQVASTLDPEGLYAVTKRAYTEMLAAGITCVGEFHYVHHRSDGAPHDDPNALSREVVRAAADVGIRLVLLEVYYARAGMGQPPLPEQRRFCDPSVEAYLQRIDVLRSEGVAIGLAPHSVRAVPRDALPHLVAYAQQHALPLHAHVSEQPLENEACQTEYGRTPTQIFAEAGAFDRARGFTAVHGIHLQEVDRQLLRDQIVCACPTTEADLGDGIVDAPGLHAAGTTLALGSDSNAVIDLVQEARLLEMHARLQDQKRLCMLGAASGARVGQTLLQIATQGGARALGVAEAQGQLAVGRRCDAVIVDVDTPFFAGLEGEDLLDAWLLAGTASGVRQVLVGGVERL